MILFEDKDWLVVDKPTGVSTHGAWEGDLAAVEFVNLHFGQKVQVVSRLDKGTSGVLPFAKNSATSGAAQLVHEHEKAEKTYYFVSKVLKDTLGVARIELSLDGKDCATELEYLHPCLAGHLYRAVIRRGRTHQIRRHAAHWGVPLLGDQEYGGDEFSRLMLHCSVVKWPDYESWAAALPNSFGDQFLGEPSLPLQLLLRLEVCLESRSDWISVHSEALRLVHRKEVVWSALDFCVDRYGDQLSCWNYGPHEGLGLLNSVLEWLTKRVGAKGFVMRTINRNSHKSGLFSDQKASGELMTDRYWVQEFGLSYTVSLMERQHIGLFLDQRDNRKRVLQTSKGKRVLNLFSYSCSFSVVAAAGECEVVMSVDSAASALELGKQNFAKNGLDASGRGKFIVDDVRKFLDRQIRKLEKDSQAKKFDIVICDPPTFSKASGFDAFSVDEEWESLARKCARIVDAQGEVYFSNNHRSESALAYEQVLKKHFGKVVKLSPPLDFRELGGQESHVKQFLCSVPKV